jgi:hypothetical protein
VAIDRCSRWAHLAVYGEFSTSAVAFLNEVDLVFTFKVTHEQTVLLHD